MTPLAVTRVGDGPPLALVHGWGFAAASLRPLAEQLARRRTVELVELPGHGGSRGLAMAGDLPGLAAQLDATLPATRDWVGWSLGGLACLQLALARPGHVRRLGLVATTPRFTACAHWPTAVAPETLATFAQALDADPATTLARFAALVAHGDRAERGVLRALRTVLAASGQPDPDALTTGLALLAESDLTGAATALATPTLWLLGTADALVPVAVAEALERWPEAEVACIAGAGHAPFLAAPAACASRLEAFLDG